MIEALFPYAVALVVLTAIGFSKKVILTFAERLKTIQIKVNFAPNDESKRH